MQVHISLFQMHIELGQPEINLRQVQSAVTAAAAEQSNLLLLPELWSSGYDLPNAALLARQTPQILGELRSLAHQHNLFIGGSMLEAAEDGLYNTFFLTPPDGSEAVKYAKVHLFGLMNEDAWLKPGNVRVHARLPWGQAGLAICYDLRFPELFRSNALDGDTAFLIPAEWPLRRISHWQTLLRARAIENQAFVIAVNNCANTGGETFGGCSAVIDPFGVPIVEGSASSPELLHAVIDPDLVERARKAIPVFRDRRPEVYGDILR